MELDKILLSRRRTLGSTCFTNQGCSSLFSPSWKVWSLLTRAPTTISTRSITPCWPSKKFPGPWIGSAPGNRASLLRRIAFRSPTQLSSTIWENKHASRGEDGGVHFYRHEVDSCRAAEKTMERLRFPGLTKEKVLRLVGNHMTILTCHPDERVRVEKAGQPDGRAHSLTCCPHPCG